MIFSFEADTPEELLVKVIAAMRQKADCHRRYAKVVSKTKRDIMVEQGKADVLLELADLFDRSIIYGTRRSIRALWTITSGQRKPPEGV